MKTAGKAPAVLPRVLLGSIPVRQAVKLPQRTLRLSANLPTLTREMPLNISIDVDGTLLDESGNLIPLALEKLLELKLKGHRLQLWSSAGAEYARQVAGKYSLTEVFESYATKPDVAFDDFPESARPVAIFRVNTTFNLTGAIDTLQSKLEECIDSVPHPSPGLVSHVESIHHAWGDIQEIDKDVLGIQRMPIPFFGNLDHARFITVGLNPSSTEFAPWREWETVSNPVELTRRLVNYFRLAGIALPPPHRWFGDILEASYNLRCPHAIAAAHVDFCPWVTAESQVTGFRNWNVFWPFIDTQMNRWLGETIQHCHKQAKLVVIFRRNDPNPAEQARLAQAERIIRIAFGPEWQGEIKILPKAELPSWTWQERVRLRNIIDLPGVIA